MDFYQVLAQMVELLQREGRASYRALKRQFDLDDDYLEDLKDAILFAHPVVDEDGRGLVWTGEADVPPEPTSTSTQPTQPEVTQEPQPTQAKAPPPEPPTPDAERRQLTVMFCDLVGSTPLSEQLDPEDLREVVRAYQQTCAEVVQRFDGHIAQLLGDALLVYFGWPQAHEDDAQRAVRTGLGMLDAMSTLNTQLERDKDIRLAIRVGIHTGLVVVGEMGGGGHQEQLALGETPNVASRLQGLAEPDTVAISEITYQLIEGYFTCQDLGEQRLKGVAEPMQVYRVLGESGVQSRLDVAPQRGLTPLVGREQEVGLLLDRWTRVKEGMGHVVVLSGEAGIGKSRLVRVLQEHVADEPHTTIECRCSPYFQHSALHPVLTMWQRGVRLHRDDTPDVKLEKLERTLSRFELPLQDTVPLFAHLLSLSLPAERYPPLALAPPRQKQQTLQTLVTIWLKVAARTPLFFIVEDLHWIDPSTLELLDLLLDQVPTTRIFTLLTCRADFRVPWASRAHVTPLILTRLHRDQVETMITRVAGGKPLPPEVVQQVAAKTDGIPLFVEELTKTVLEAGFLREANGQYVLTGPLPTLSIPTTLQDSLMARLDRLVTAKGIAQLGATIGRQFSYELLQAASQLDDTTLQRELVRLVEHEILYQRGLPPQAIYVFKHSLIRDAAYQSLLRSTRQQYHQRIAQMLVEHFPDIAATQPELLAHHYTEAGLPEQATDYWQQAGQRAIERSANLEAITHLTKGLQLLKALPATTKRTQRELDIQTALCVPLAATRSITSPEVGQAYKRAWEICQHVGDTPHFFPVLLGLYRFHTLRGEFQTARELEEQLLDLAHRELDPARLIEVHRRLGTTRFHRGEFTATRTHCKQVTTLYDPLQHHAQVYVYGWLDAGVSALGYEAYALWVLGYPEQALRQSRASLRLAEELSHPLSLAFAHHFMARIHQHRGEGQLAYEHAERAIAISTKQGFPARKAVGTILRGWALAAQGQHDAGIAQMRQGLGDSEAMEAGVVTRPYFLTLLAETYAQMSQIDAGLQVVGEAMATVSRGQDYEAELYRLKGELLLAQSVKNDTEAESCFHHALDIARRQQAKSWELRAATSLARLWQSQDKRQDASALLAPVYGWFTEGFDTADLQEAKALLEELA
jgi:class 3 adenylate cyclase/predicted ATPase